MKTAKTKKPTKTKKSNHYVKEYDLCLQTPKQVRERVLERIKIGETYSINVIEHLGEGYKTFQEKKVKIIGIYPNLVQVKGRFVTRCFQYWEIERLLNGDILETF